MNANLTPTSSMVRRGRMAVAVLAAAMALAAGCGSDDTATTNTAKPAGAKENTTTAQCYTWTYPTVSTTQATCAVGAQGPGGGRIFYDAGGQTDGWRFLEVARQDWNLAYDKLLDCPGSGLIGSSCGSSDKNKIPKKTSDYSGNRGWYACTKGSKMMLEASADRLIDTTAQKLGTAIGTGKDNTEKILAAGQCTVANPDNIEENWSAFQKAANYRGPNNLNDWFIGSKDELVELCKYTGRNDIGGFPGEAKAWRYISSTTSAETATILYSGTQWSSIFFSTPDCSDELKPIPYNNQTGSLEYAQNLVRPIRRF